MLRETPIVSVIITAHDRRTYLAGAVDSVLRQNVRRSTFEIIVVKNFKDEQLDDEFRREGVQVVYQPSAPVGPKLKQAISLARGELLAFLEDDDLFTENKLQHVTALFRRYPQMGLLRNGFLTIDVSGNANTAPRVWQKQPRLRHGTVVSHPVSSLWSTIRLGRIHPDYNTSSMVIRTSLVIPYLNHLEKVELVPDAFLFFIALISGRAIGVDSTPVTRVRAHVGSASEHFGKGGTNVMNRLLAFSQRNWQSYEEFLELARSAHSEDGQHLARQFLETERVLLLFRQGGLHRTTAARHLLELLARADNYYFWSRLDVLAAAAGSLISPSLTEKIYRRAKAAGY